MSLKRDQGLASVQGLCRRAGVSRQAFYRERRVRRRREVDGETIVQTVVTQRKIHPRVGTRKLMRLIGPDLEAMEIRIGRDRLFELLREKGMLIKRRRGGPRTTDSRHAMRVYPNLIRDAAPSGPNQVWVSDLTYLRTREGFLYLSLITDAYSRKIIGRDVDDTLEAEGCVRALKRALRQLPDGLRPTHHSDRGTQYCCHDYIGLLKSRDLRISMTEFNHCYENAKAERVNGILKDEYGLGQTFPSKRQAKEACLQAIRIYNQLRPHLSLDYQTPASVHGRQEVA
jgi:putative transposase